MTKAGAGGGGAAQTITLDGAGTGRVFDGMGAISGGGGNSRLLHEYPAPQRSDVLDYLFRPGYGAAMHILNRSCPADPSSEGLGIPLWASENGSQDFNSGAEAMARAMNRGYIDAQMTSFINWPLIASILPKLSWETDGVAVANQPWSGWYSMGKQLWVMAHTTQFTEPGWRYIDKASGYIGGNRSNGSYVTIRSQGDDYSVIWESVWRCRNLDRRTGP